MDLCRVRFVGGSFTSFRDSDCHCAAHIILRQWAIFQLLRDNVYTGRLVQSLQTFLVSVIHDCFYFGDGYNLMYSKMLWNDLLLRMF